MNLARHSITSSKPVHIYDARFEADCQIFTTATPAGFAVYKTCPLQLLRKRELVGGTLSLVVPLHSSSLLFLVGGGRSPLYPPNKVIFWDDAIGADVAELEFRERVRGLACRRGWLSVALKRRVVVFKIGKEVTKHAEWETGENVKGLVALASAPYATLLAVPGRQMGHVQLIHLPPCPSPTPLGPPPSSLPSRPPPPPTKQPVSIIAAHTTALTTLTVPPSGKYLATTSSRGTLVRVWDTLTGKLVRELRRGTDKADIFGVAFRPDEQELCVWSDKGTVHIFTLVQSTTSNSKSTFSPLSPYIRLPKYFESEWSYSQYRIPVQSAHIALSSAGTKRSETADIPDEERCVVGWIETESGQFQLVALTYAGGWYRLSVPSPSEKPSSSSSGSKSTKAASSSARPRSVSGFSTSSSSRVDKGKERERDKESKDCVLEEFRRFGRWDGWA